MTDAIEEATATLLEELGSTELVVADTNKFKIKLGIGEDAYASLRIKNLLETVGQAKDAVGIGSAGAATVAGLLPSAGLLTKAGIFLGVASAPVSAPVVMLAVAGAGLISGGAYFGAMRLMSSAGSSRVETIPKFINTPIDLLGATIFDLMGGLAVKVAGFSAPVDDAERAAIIDYFADAWGISPDYARRALPLIEHQVRNVTLKQMVRTLAEQQMDNPDCNPEAMRKALREFLEEIAHADGDLDEREELAIELVERELAAHLSTTAQLSRRAGKYAAQAAVIAQGGGAVLAKGAQSALGRLRGALRKTQG